MDVKQATAELHPDACPTTIWGFDGRYPGPMIKATYGQPVLLRLHNALPSVKQAPDFGIAEIATHLHSGHSSSESDGFPIDYALSRP